jgi:hypothetical protein
MVDMAFRAYNGQAGQDMDLARRQPMKVDVRFRGLDRSPSLIAYVVRRAQLRFSHFNGAIHLVVIRIGDVNGPKGGADKRCQVTIRGPALGTISVVDQSADAHSAVDLVLERAARAAGRNIEQARSVRRHDTGAQQS